MKVIIPLIVILIVCVFIGIYISQNPKQLLDLISSFLEGRCVNGRDCAWVITNCCPESSGAKWECVNMNYFKERGCMEKNICPQVYSPRPNAVCVCSEGKCVGVYEAEG